MPRTASAVGVNEREFWFGIDLIKQIVDLPLGTGLVVVYAIGKPRLEASRDPLEEEIGKGNSQPNAIPVLRAISNLSHFAMPVFSVMTVS